MVYAILNGMTVVNDKARRIVVPKKEKPSLAELHGLLVHLSRAEAGADWDIVLENIREERLQDTISRLSNGS